MESWKVMNNTYKYAYVLLDHYQFSKKKQKGVKELIIFIKKKEKIYLKYVIVSFTPTFQIFDN